LRNPANDFVEDFIGRHHVYAGHLETVRDVMSERAVCAKAEMSLIEAVDRMRRERVSSLFLVDEERHLIGQVTVEDIQNSPCADVDPLSALNKGVGESVTVNDSAKETFDLMMRLHLDALPVLNEKRQVIGAVTRKSMVSSLASTVWEGGHHG